MAEALIAQLGLDLGGFTSALQQAQQQMQAFAQQVAQQLNAATNALNQFTSAQQQATQVQQRQHQATQQTTQAVQAQSSAMQQAKQATTDWTQALQIVKGLGIAVTIQGIVTELKNFASAAVDAAKEAVRGFAAFEAQLLKVGTQIEGFSRGAQFDALSDAVHNMAIRFGRDTGDINKALFELEALFGNTAKAMAVLESSGRLAVGGFTDIFTASKAVSAVLKGFNLDVSDSEKVANALFVAARQGRQDVGAFAGSISSLLPVLGVYRLDLRDAGAALSLLTAENFTAGEAATSLRHIIDAIGAPTVRAQKYFTELAEKTGVAKIELQRFGDGTVDLISTFKQFEGLSPDLLRRLIPSETARLGLLTAINNLEGLKKALDVAHQGTNALADANKLAGSSIEQAWKQASQAIQAFYDAVGKVIGQNASFVGMVAHIQSAFIQLTQSVVQNREQLTALVNAFSTLGNIAISVLQAMGNMAIWVASKLGTVAQAAAQAAGAFQASMSWIASKFNAVGSVLGLVNPAQPAQATAPIDPYAAYQAELARRGIAAFGAPDLGAVVAPPRAAPRFSLDDFAAGKGRGGGRGRADNSAAREAEQFAEHIQSLIGTRPLKDIEKDIEALSARLKEAKLPGEILAIANALEKVKGERQDLQEPLIKVLADQLEDMGKAFGEEEAQIAEAKQSAEAYLATLQKLREWADADGNRVQYQIVKITDEMKKLAKEGGIATDMPLFQSALTSRLEQEVYAPARKKQQDELDKTRKAYEKLVDDIARPIASVFESLQSGVGNILDNIKQMFIRFLSDLAAEAIAKQIVIYFGASLLGGNAAGGGGIAGASSSGGVGQAFSAASTVAGGASAGDILGSATSVASLGGKSGLFKNILNTPVNSLFGGGSYSGPIGPTESGAPLGSSATVGEALGGIGVGMVIGSVTNTFIYGKNQTKAEEIGGLVGGVVGGAIGTAILPGIGSIIGAFLGELIGAFAGSLFGAKPPDPQLKFTQLTTPTVSYDQRFGLQLATPFHISGEKLKDVGAVGIQGTGKYGGGQLEEFNLQLENSFNGLIQKTLNDFRSAAPQIQAALVAPLNAELNKLTDSIKGYQFSGSHLTEFVDDLFNNVLPTQLARDLQPLTEAVQRINPIVVRFNEIIKQANDDIVKLQQAAIQQHLSLQTSIVGIQEGLYSPAQQYVARQRQLQQALGLLEQATPQQQTILIPQIQQLTQDIFGLAKNTEVLGQDPQALRNLQAQLTSILQGLQGTSAGAFSSLANTEQQQANLAQQQITALVATLSNPTDKGSITSAISNALDQLTAINNVLAGTSPTAQSDATAQVQTALLTGSVQALSSIDQTEQQSLAVLQQIAQAMAGAPGHQAGIAYVPYTGIAMLHQGERVLTAQENARGAGGGGDIVININGGSNADAMVDTIIRKIEQKGGRLQGSKIMVRN